MSAAEFRARSVQASTTTERFVAQEMMKLKLSGCAPKFGPWLMDGLTQTDLPGLTSGSGSRGHIAKERDESFGHGGMGEDCIA